VRERTIVRNLKYSWQQAYLKALTEIDPEKLPACVEAADDAAFDRLLELEGSAEADQERIALEDTIGYIRLLQRYSYHLRD
jgi:hypothetical protein